MITYYESVVPKERSDALTQQEDQATEGLHNKFDDLKDKEKELQFEIQSVRLSTLTSQVTEANLIAELYLLKEMRVLKFPGIFQALLLFLGHTKELINKPSTNQLDWTKTQSLITDSLFDSVYIVCTPQ